MLDTQTNSARSGAKRLLVAGASLIAMAAFAAPAAAYTVHPLVTDDQSVLAALPYGPAPTVDPALINPWDISSTAEGNWFVANAGGTGAGAPGTLTKYDDHGRIVHPTIAVPEGSSAPYGPTGVSQVTGDGFMMPNGHPAKYIVDNLDGSVSAWDGGNSTQTVVPGRGPGGNTAIYTSLEVAASGGATYLYAANAITGTVDVFDTHFAKVSLAGAFVDPGPNPNSLIPNNIENIGTHLWVTYTEAGPPASSAPVGYGFVSEFNTDGTFVRRFATGGKLSSPWGLVVAPANFGKYSNDVLIGNFKDDMTTSWISAFDPTTGKYLGRLKEKSQIIVLPGLWGLQFGSGRNANKLFFAAGIGNESHGLFGFITGEESAN